MLNSLRGDLARQNRTFYDRRKNALEDKTAWVAGAAVSQDELVKRFTEVEILVLDEIGAYRSLTEREKDLLLKSSMNAMSKCTRRFSFQTSSSQAVTASISISKNASWTVYANKHKYSSAIGKATGGN